MANLTRLGHALGAVVSAKRWVSAHGLDQAQAVAAAHAMAPHWPVATSLGISSVAWTLFEVTVEAPPPRLEPAGPLLVTRLGVSGDARAAGQPEVVGPRILAALSALGEAWFYWKCEPEAETRGTRAVDSAAVWVQQDNTSIAFHVRNAAEPARALVEMVRGGGLPVAVETVDGCTRVTSTDADRPWTGTVKRELLSGGTHHDLLCDLGRIGPDELWRIIAGATAARGCRKVLDCSWSHIINRAPQPPAEVLARYQEIVDLDIPATKYSLEGSIGLASLDDLEHLIAFVGPKGTFELGGLPVDIDARRSAFAVLAKDRRGFAVGAESEARCTEDELRRAFGIPVPLRPR